MQWSNSAVSEGYHLTPSTQWGTYFFSIDGNGAGETNMAASAYSPDDRGIFWIGVEDSRSELYMLDVMSVFVVCQGALAGGGWGESTDGLTNGFIIRVWDRIEGTYIYPLHPVSLTLTDHVPFVMFSDPVLQALQTNRLLLQGLGGVLNHTLYPIKMSRCSSCFQLRYGQRLEFVVQDNLAADPGPDVAVQVVYARGLTISDAPDRQGTPSNDRPAEDSSSTSSSSSSSSG